MAIDQGWYVANEGKQDGPFSGEILANMAAQGQLRPESMVWREGMADWTAAGAVPELGGMFQAAAAPAPPPFVAPAPPPMGQAPPMGQYAPAARPAEVPAWLKGILWGGANEHVAGLRKQSRFLLSDIFTLAGVFLVVLGAILPWYSTPMGGFSGLRRFPGIMTLILGLAVAGAHVAAMFMPLQIWTRITVRGATFLGAIMVLLGLIGASSFMSSPGFGIFIAMFGGLAVVFGEVVLSLSQTGLGLALAKRLGGGGAPVGYQQPMAPQPGPPAGYQQPMPAQPPVPQAQQPMPAQPAAPVPPQAPAAQPTGDVGAALGQIAQLKAQGLISEQEYEAKKKELLDRI